VIKFLLPDLLVSSFASGYVALVLSVGLVPDASFVQSLALLALKLRSLSVSVYTSFSVLFLFPSASLHACC
jgi:hypothetical protein